MSSGARGAAGFLWSSRRGEASLLRMQRAMDAIYQGGRKRDARRAAEALKLERENGISTAPQGAQRR